MTRRPLSDLAAFALFVLACVFDWTLRTWRAWRWLSVGG